MEALDTEIFSEARHRALDWPWCPAYEPLWSSLREQLFMHLFSLEARYLADDLGEE